MFKCLRKHHYFLNPFWFSLAIIVAFAISIPHAKAEEDTISLFPLDNYDQSVSTWINPSTPDYDKNLMGQEQQQKRLDNFYDHYFGIYSPWNTNYVNKQIHLPSPDDVKTIQLMLINDFDNENKPIDQIGYGENFRPRTKEWLNTIVDNMNLTQFDNINYKNENRGIIVENSHARALPTDDVFFYHYKIAGQGYPFDNLQYSAVWVGTPVYIIGQSRDQAWLLVLTPDFIAWIKNKSIARVTEKFVSTWTKSTKQQMAAIIKPNTSLSDYKGHFITTTYVGSIFPAKSKGSWIELSLPVKNAKNIALVVNVAVNPENAAMMPLAATPHHFADIIQNHIGRPYSWGGKYFYNDCSAELKSLFTPFGIWLPRHSSAQLKAGMTVDLSALTPEQRLNYLNTQGRAFMTLIYTGGHIVLYAGKISITPEQPPILMTYQNVWGLHPNPPTRRAVIGKAVLFPLLLQYPEDNSLVSQAGGHTFKIAYLDIL